MLRGSGNIVFDNQNISGLRPDQVCQKGIARTFQIPVVFPTLTVSRNVEVGAYFGTQGTQRKKGIINEVINFVGLQGKENVVAAGIDLFSKKMTMLAAALATKPKLLLLDEVVAGLSPTETSQFVELVGKINRELGITIMVIEHLMKVLTEICQRLMIVHYGEQICIGPPKEVTENSRVREIYLA
jgi:branched-chain amino acid transport system ATP-binding protein